MNLAACSRRSVARCAAHGMLNFCRIRVGSTSCCRIGAAVACGPATQFFQQPRALETGRQMDPRSFSGRQNGEQHFPSSCVCDSCRQALCLCCCVSVSNTGCATGRSLCLMRPAQSRSATQSGLQRTWICSGGPPAPRWPRCHQSRLPTGMRCQSGGIPHPLSMSPCTTSRRYTSAPPTHPAPPVLHRCKAPADEHYRDRAICNSHGSVLLCVQAEKNARAILKEVEDAKLAGYDYPIASLIALRQV